MWLTERTLHQLAGGKKTDYVKYSDFISKALDGAESTERSRTPKPSPRSGEDILKEFMPIIEADRGRSRG